LARFTVYINYIPLPFPTLTPLVSLALVLSTIKMEAVHSSRTHKYKAQQHETSFIAYTVRTRSISVTKKEIHFTPSYPFHRESLAIWLRLRAYFTHTINSTFHKYFTHLKLQNMHYNPLSQSRLEDTTTKAALNVP
jgi:hypothetical protein